MDCYAGALFGLTCCGSLAAALHESAQAGTETPQIRCSAATPSQPKRPTARTWRLVGQKRFFLHRPRNSFTGLYRSQGIATDGDHWFFSWQYGLEIADRNFESLRRNSAFYPPGTPVPGIPPSLLSQGLNHIGDIDYHDGIIYASLDTTNGYNSAHVALYDATDLSYIGAFELTGAPFNPKKDIASWVAVEPGRNRGYGKEWQCGNTINVYNLRDWSFSHTLTLDTALERIQGAKVCGDWLYMAADDATQSVYRANLLNGHVEGLFRLPRPAGDRELEGIAVRGAHTTHDRHEACDEAVDIYVEMIVDPDRSERDPSNRNLHVSLHHYTLAPGRK
jgi:hypothetical protein